MCRRPAQFCTELGPDPSLWPTSQPLPTPPQAREAANAVSECLTFALAGDAEACRDLLTNVVQLPLQEWFDVHAQNAAEFRHRHFVREPIVRLPRADRDRPYPTVTMERDIYRRDEGKCRFCGMPVLLRQDQRVIHRLVGDDLFQMGTTNATRSGAMIVSRASADHVVPVSQGGRTTPDNLVTACWPCQFGKGGYTPEQLGILAPQP